MSAAEKPTAKPTRSPSKKVKVKFSATGTVTTVDAAASTIALVVKGGTKDVKGKTVTVSVPTSVRILLNGRKVQLSALMAGQKITVTGTRIDTAYTAAKIQATGKDKNKPAPTPSATATPTTPASPTATPSASPTESGDPETAEAP
nr:hypothetical protein Ade03nite_46520 [Actinoplanes derwentensis]